MDPETVEITIAVRTRAGTRCIEVSGDVDHFSAPDVRRTLETAVAEHPGRIEVDLAGTTFFCCAAADALIEAHRASGGRVTLVGETPAVRRVLDLCGLTATLTAPAVDY